MLKDDLTVLFVDDDPFLAGFAKLLAHARVGIKAVGCATHSSDAIRQAQVAEPKVAIVDLDLAPDDVDGLTVIEHLAALPRPPMILA